MSTPSAGGNSTEALIASNLQWLSQALDLLDQIDDRSYRESPAGLAPHRVSGHLRHIIEFYECFLDGAPIGLVDYDARLRDESIERSRVHAATRVRLLMDKLRNWQWPGSYVVRVRMEDAPTGIEDVFLNSSVARELQILSSHTIHHFALISLTLRAHGIVLPSEFGMAPSTLRYQETLKARGEAA